MQLWQHPNGVYYILHGERLRRQLSTRTKDRRLADRRLAEFIAGHGSPVPDAPTVGVILDGYKQGRTGKVRAPNALKFAVKALAERLGDLRPAHLTRRVIENYAAQRGAAPGTILREIGTLRAALNWAFESGWMGPPLPISNPVAAPEARDRWLTHEEAGKLLAACQEPHLRVFITLALTTVARSGAILTARWGQVDFSRKVIDYGRGYGNKRRAVVPLNEDALAALGAARELAASDYIVEYRGAPIRSLKTTFGAAVTRAGLVGVTPHILRHTGASWMVQAGVPIAKVARMLGDSEAVTEKVYAKHAPGFLADAAAALKLPPKPGQPALKVQGEGAKSAKNC